MKTNQRTRVLDYIRKYDGITSWEAFMELGVTRLSAVIFDLKKEGYAFDDTNIKKLNRFGEPVCFKRYQLAEEK